MFVLLIFEKLLKQGMNINIMKKYVLTISLRVVYTGF